MAKLSKLEEEEKLATINIFTWKAFKLPRVIYKKMGKHWGLFHPTRNLIEIDSRLRGKKEMEISIHELLHWALPFLNEDANTGNKLFYTSKNCKNERARNLTNPNETTTPDIP